MATLGPKPINELPLFTTLTGNEYVPLQLGNKTGSAQLQQIVDLISGGNYSDLEAAIVSLGATITDVQASVLEFIAGGGSSGGGTELPGSISALLARVLPEGGTEGQIPYRTPDGAGYAAWGDPPTGGTTTPPTPSEDFTAGTAAMDESTASMDDSAADMNAQSATLE